MAYSEAMRRAQAEYRRKSVRQIGVRFYPDTMELYEWAKAQGLITSQIDTAPKHQCV